MTAPTIRAATPHDEDAVWKILEPIIRDGETCAFPLDCSREEVLAFWFAADHAVFVAEDHAVVGTYFLAANRSVGHLARIGYATDPSAQASGIARAMYEHSVVYAKARGFRAMQFNFVMA